MPFSQTLNFYQATIFFAKEAGFFQTLIDSARDSGTANDSPVPNVVPYHGLSMMLSKSLVKDTKMFNSSEKNFVWKSLL